MNSAGILSLLTTSALLSKNQAFCPTLNRDGHPHAQRGKHPWVNIKATDSTSHNNKIKMPQFLYAQHHRPSSQHYMAFEPIDTIEIPSIRSRLDCYEDKETGAKHYHYQPLDETSEKGFSVLFKTVPTDSTGVAHILEHSVLAGSEKYPLKDPFFSMMRRSLVTYLNALTSSDWTQYPFATQNSKDFFNLLSVYTDAVFFSLLEPEVFAQEGHHIRFEDPTNSTTPLVYNGVVYNEMIGAMDSPTREIAQILNAHLFPNTTYHYNSGGDPLEIPNLTYEQFRQFHETHYHPSNAAFMTYGDIPVKAFHQQIEEQVLSRFSDKRPSISLPLERTLTKPTQVIEHYALDNSDGQKKTHHVVGWVLGPSGNAQESLEMSFLGRVLMGNSAAPLRQFLNKYPNALSPSALNGVDQDAARMSFLCGIEGSEPQFADDFETALLKALETIATDGVPQSTLESVCHQMELSRREVKGAISNLFKLIPTVVYDSDPQDALDMDASLNYLSEQIKDPQYIKSLVREKLLDNPHRLRLTAIPDPELNSKKQQIKRDRLDTLRQSLTTEEVEQIIDQSITLKARQHRQEDSDILPKLTLDDIPAEVVLPKPVQQSDQATVTLRSDDHTNAIPDATIYQTTTNGISYINTIMPLPALTAAEKSIFPLYETILMSLGVNEADYLEMQQRQSSITGGCGTFSHVKTSADTLEDHSGYFGLSTKSLNHNLDKATALLNHSFEGVRFDEVDRIKELVKSIRLGSERGITQSGHQLAMLAAASHHSPTAHLEHIQAGLAGIAQLQRIDDRLNEPDAIEALTSHLQSIHAKMLSLPKCSLLISDTIDAQHTLDSITPKQSSNINYTAFKHSDLSHPKNEIWVTQTESNFCAKAFSGVAEKHPDSAALKVLATLLTWQQLHTSIRESGGAYGGGAGYDHSNGVFKFYSYRDPRNVETLADFDRSVEWALNSDITNDMLDQAKLSTISQLDKPGTPVSEANKAFFTELQGRDIHSISDYRQAVLNVNVDDLKRVAAHYLSNQPASTAIITSESGYDAIVKASNIEFNRYSI